MNTLRALPVLARAALWMMGTLTSFTLMAISSRELTDTLSVFEVLFFRSVVGLVVVIVLVQASSATGGGGWAMVKSKQPRLQVMRNVVHFGGQYGWVYGIALLPLAEVFAIEFTLPIWVAIMAVVFLGEQMNRMRLLAVVMGFVGVLVILRPGFQVVEPAALAVLAGALFYASAYTMTKGLTRTDSPLSIIFYMCVVQLPIGFFMMQGDWVEPVWADVPWMVIFGVTALSAHYCLARAFKLADATLVVPMDFLRLPLITVIGLLIYGEVLDPLVLVGAALIFIGNYISIRHEHRMAKTAEAVAE